MAKQRSKYGYCSVTGCSNEHKSLFLVPSSEPMKTQWMDFIFAGNIPSQLPKVVHVCAMHFKEDCFHNVGEYKLGFAKKLKLKNGSTPTVRDTRVEGSSSSSATTLSPSVDVACQTDPLDRRSVGTQLSIKTLQAHFRSAGIQATVSCKDFGVGTSPEEPFHLSSSPMKNPSKRPRLELDDELELEDSSSEDSSSTELSKRKDSTYDPAQSVTSSPEPTPMSEESSMPTHNIRKYIVYESCLTELFTSCPVCTRACSVRTQKRGTFLSVEQRCPHCEFSRHWKSQPLLESTPAGNLQLSAAVYLSGASFMQIAKVFEAMKLQTFQYHTFRRHARAFIEPAVVHHWKTSQDAMLQQLSQGDKRILGGDMRADSTEHSAKYGSYTMMDLCTNKVVDIQLVQSNEVGGSCHMEEEGLRRSVALLDARGVTLDCIVTDRHPQIQKFLREINITQYYGVLHMAKGISRKIEKIAKKKGCEKLQKWMKSINNHVYWTAATSTTGPERVAKWTSILNHVQDIHTHDDPLYPKCLHEIRRTRDKNKWLQAGTPAFYKLEKVLTNKRTLKEVAKLSPHHQTSPEAFHRVILRFAPKNVAFPFIGMLCRLYLAAMYYNENSAHKTEPTFGYVADMMDLIFDKVFVDPAPYTNALLAIPVPEDLTAECERPEGM